jgi:hypothetical protein
VTAFVGDVRLSRSMIVGDIVETHAQLAHTGRSSMHSSSGAHGPDKVTSAGSGVRSGAAGLACVIAVVWATDGLSVLVLGRRGWVETVEAIVDRPSTASIGASGSMVGGVEVVAWLGFGAGALIVLVEMIIRLAAVVLLAVAVPVMAAAASVQGFRTVSSRPPAPPSLPPGSWLSSAWSARLLCALRWSVVAVLVKPILLLALVIGAVELACSVPKLSRGPATWRSVRLSRFAGTR